MAKTQLQKIGELLVLIGAIVALIFGILEIIGLGTFGLGIWSVGSVLPGFGIILGIILIIFSLITLATSGVIKFPWKFEKNWVMLLILGIILIIFGGGIGAVLVIIGAILMIF
ncbi:MAG: hypothetical protein Q6361_03330 [Candidatus Hermodarchaeota archaeon]|nr:hypothetical protein [Candidatus Hermodarchaeota archaeon]